MTASSLRSGNSVSPYMLLLSLLLHGTCFFTIVCLYSFSSSWRKPADTVISRVKLVDGGSIAPVTENLAVGPKRNVPLLKSEEILEVEPAPKAAEPAANSIKTKSFAQPVKDAIPLNKRKKPLQRVEAPKPKKPPPTEKKETKEREDPQSLIEKRLAAIRSEVEKRKDTVSSGSPRGAQDSRIHGRNAEGQGGVGADPELVRWLDLVRSRINNHWSLLGDNRDPTKMMVIGIRIGDDGTLRDASVEKTSGDAIFDGSAMRAVFQAAPFPPVPPSVRERITREGGLALRFTSAGMQ